LADDFSERDQAIGHQFRVLDEFRGSFRSVQSYLHSSGMFDERFVRVDPWLGLRFNLAMNQKIALVLILLFGTGLNSFAQTNSTPGAPTAGIVAATKKFLATLDDAQRGKVVFDFKDEAQRKRWSNLPTAIFKRQGLRIGDLTGPQREAVLAVLAAALSPQGYEKILQIVEADEVLRNSSGQTIFGRDEYYVSFLGQPSTTEPWMIQFGGHHLGLNITLAGEQRTLAPSHTGAQPAIYELEARRCAPSVARLKRRLPCLVR
jgi:hypothetical protein